MRVFLDANILFSAANPDSRIRGLVEGIARFGVAVSSAHAWEEARRNLARKRPHFLGGLDKLVGIVLVSHGFQHPGETDLTGEDIPILAGAVGSKCEYLLTGDKKHFGKWYGKKLKSVEILPASLMAGVLLAKGWKP